MFGQMLFVNAIISALIVSTLAFVVTNKAAEVAAVRAQSAATHLNLNAK